MAEDLRPEVPDIETADPPLPHRAVAARRRPHPALPRQLDRPQRRQTPAEIQAQLNPAIAGGATTGAVDAQKYADQLQGRSMLVMRAEMIPVECVVRGYISGSAWKEYKTSGRVCGIELPAGLKESSKLPQPIFTPATKATTGHDENISFDEMTRIVGVELSRQLRELSLKVYTKAADYALQKGIIIADTKFEFGMTSKGITLADEVLTPDSSRFWPADKYQPGRAQDSYDKQYVRDYLEEIHWDKQPPAPALPVEVARRTSDKYLEAFHQLTGRELDV